MIPIECAQYSEEWWSHVIGNPGASSMHKIITPTGKPSGQFDRYLKDKVHESITGIPAESFSNWKMQQKLDREHESREDWEFKNGIEIVQVGLCYKDINRYFHCSPDGLMPDLKWGFETKDADAHIQAERLEDHESGGNKFYMQHKVQVQASLYITGYEKWILQSYCRNMKPLTLEIEPDLEFHKNLETGVYEFVGKQQKQIKEWKKKGWIK